MSLCHVPVLMSLCHLQRLVCGGARRMDTTLSARGGRRLCSARAAARGAWTPLCQRAVGGGSQVVAESLHHLSWSGGSSRRRRWLGVTNAARGRTDYPSRRQDARADTGAAPLTRPLNFDMSREADEPVLSVNKRRGLWAP